MRVPSGTEMFAVTRTRSFVQRKPLGPERDDVAQRQAR